MEHSSERKLRLWHELSRANEAQMKVEGKHWRKRFFFYMGVIVATVAVTTILANIGR
jgi:hypothetical protein